MSLSIKYILITVFLTFLQFKNFASTGITTATITPVISIIDASCSSSTGSVTITSVTNGTPNYTITEGVTTLTTNVNVPFTITNVSVGTHTYVVIDGSGSTASFTATVAQNLVPPNLTVVSPVTINCIPSTTTLSASSTSTDVISYSWTGANIINGASTATPTVGQIGNYTVTLTQGSCTTKSVVSVVSNTNSPSVSISKSGNITCSTPTVLLTGSSMTPGVTFSWTPPNVTTNTVVVNSIGSYTLFVTNPIGGCISSTVIVVKNDMVPPDLSITPPASLSCVSNTVALNGNSITGGITFSWSPQGVTTSSAVANAVGIYTLTIQNLVNGCISIGTVSVGQNTISPTLSITPSSTTVCAGQTLTLTASGASTYTWTNPVSNLVSVVVTPTATTVYTLTGTSAFGCVGSAVTQTITTAVSPTITVASTSSICAGQSATITANGANTFSITGGSSFTTSTTVTPTITTTYTIVGNNGGSCASSSTVSVLVNTPTLSLTPNFTICSGNAALITATTNATSILWNTGVVTNTLSVSPLINTVYTMTANLAGCKKIDSVAVTVLTKVTSGIKATFTDKCNGMLDFSCINNSLNNRWLISNGDSVLNSCLFPYQFVATGNYTVTLITNPNSNCADTAKTPVTINSISNIVYDSAPNVFTPNGDGVNDLIDFSKYIACAAYEFEIFDRWGLSIVKSTNSKQTYWDGRTTSGEEVSAGTYFFYLKTSKQTYKGTISLFR